MEDWDGKFEMVDPRLVVVDHRYQRDEKETLVSRIAQSPSWEAFGAISCYRRDNNVLVCVDGQQRLRGILASENPPKKVPAIIFEKAKLKDEASTFVTINIQRKAVTPIEKHRGLVVAGNPAALAIERALDTTGFSLAYGGQSSSSPKNIGAIAALYEVYNTLGEEGLVQVLVQIRDAWPKDTQATSQGIIRGLCYVMIDLGTEYHRGKLTTQLSKTSPTEILRESEALKFDMGGSKQTNIRRAFKKLAKV